MNQPQPINYPLLLDPVYKDYIWGGDRIPRRFHRDLPPGIYAESWEIADRPEGMSTVSNGPLAGTTLRRLMDISGTLLGGHGEGDLFPLLIKIIDSKQCLSVQVHPNNRNADTVGGEPKTEMWHVLAADPGARVFAGLKDRVDEKTFMDALEREQLQDVLRSVPVTAGDTIFVPGGRVHAIDAGCLLLEVQQNSNTTYRVYDWGRLGHDGKPRPLHLEQALQVIDWNDNLDPRIQPGAPVQHGAGTISLLLDCPFFRLERIDLLEEITEDSGRIGVHALFVSAGKCRIETRQHTETLCSGTSCLLPADIEPYRLAALDPCTQLLRISLP